MKVTPKISFVFLLALIAFSVQANDQKVKFYQPSGDFFYAYWRGDDVFKYIQSPTGSILIKDQDTGRYEYATFYNVADTPMLIPSGFAYKRAKDTSSYQNFSHPQINVWPKDLEEIRDYLR